MADKNQPQVKIGHYIIGDTLGVGTFGKVKSMGNTAESIIKYRATIYVIFIRGKHSFCRHLLEMSTSLNFVNRFVVRLWTVSLTTILTGLDCSVICMNTLMINAADD